MKTRHRRGPGESRLSTLLVDTSPLMVAERSRSAAAGFGRLLWRARLIGRRLQRGVRPLARLCRQKVFDRQTDVFGDLTKQCRRNIASLMKWYGRPATVSMTKLSVRTPLSDFREPQLREKRHDLARLENRPLRHALRHFDGLSPDEFAFESGVAFLKEHFDYFLEVRPQLVECLALAMRARKARHPPDIQACLGVPLDDRRKVLHGEVLSVWNDTKTLIVVPAAERFALTRGRS